MQVSIKSNLCKGCGICVAFCPGHCLELNERGKVEINRDACISCGQCELRCPDFAIELVQEEAE